MHRTISGARVLITGASGGLGRALALELARQHASVVLLARRANRLDAVADEIRQIGGRALCVVGDVTDPEARQRALNAAQTELGGLDFLINNAGAGAIGRFEETDPERIRQILELNFFAPVELTRAAIPLLRASNRPIITNIGSVLGHRATPLNSEYCAAKFALRGWNDSLRIELAPWGIDVLLVSLGPIRSEFWEHLVGQNQPPPWSTRYAIPADRAARKIVRAIQSGRRELIPTFLARWFVRAGHLIPGIMDRVMRRYV
jgi:short-subunit dehydrogenase